MVGQLQVMHVERLNRRDRLAKGDEPKFVPSFSILIKTADFSFPTAVQVFGCPYKLHLYVPQAKMCYACFRYGHIRAQCRGKALCGKCGESSHREGEVCKLANAAPKCVNCGGDHLPMDRTCKEFEFQRKVREFATRERISNVEAIVWLMRNEPPNHPTHSGNRISGFRGPAGTQRGALSQNGAGYPRGLFVQSDFPHLRPHSSGGGGGGGLDSSDTSELLVFEDSASSPLNLRGSRMVTNLRCICKGQQ